MILWGALNLLTGRAFYPGMDSGPSQSDIGAQFGTRASYAEEFPESSSEQPAGRLRKTADFLEGINRKIGRR